MRRGLPTFLFLLLFCAGLALWGWSLTRAPASSDDDFSAKRTMPADGWGPLRVMTANIRLAEPSDGDNIWVNRRDLVTKTFLKYHADVIACQEVTPAQGADLNLALATWYLYYPRAGVGESATRATKAGSGGGNVGGISGAAGELLGALASTVASLNTIYYRIDRLEAVDGEAGLIVPEDLQANRTENAFFSMVVLKEKGSAGAKLNTFIIVDVHLRHGQAFAVKCAKRLRERIAGWQKQSPGASVIVLGDMNHSRVEATYAALTTGADTPATTPTSIEASKTADGQPLLVDTFDYTAKRKDEMWGNYHNFTGTLMSEWPTDLILVSPDLHVAKDGAARIIRDQGANGRYPSDHYFVVADVEKN